MKLFSVKHKHWALFRNIQEIRRCFYFLSYCFNWHVGFQEFSMAAYSH